MRKKLFRCENEYKEVKGAIPYQVTFKDAEGVTQIAEVEKEILDVLCDDFVKTARNLESYNERHIEHIELSENELYIRCCNVQQSVEDMIIKKSVDKEMYKNLHNAMEKLTKVQFDRIYLYYFEYMTLEEIAKQEGRTFQAIAKSIKQGLAKLKTNM